LKVLLIRFSSIGDIVFTLAVPEAIKNKYSDWELHFLTKYEYKDLIEGNPFIDKKIYFKKKEGLLSLIKSLKKEKYDLIYDAHNSLRSNIILLFLYKAKIIQYSKQRLKRFLLLVFKINLYKKLEYPFFKFLKPLKKINIHKFKEYPKIYISYEILERIKVKIERYLKNKERKLIVLAPGAAWKGKIWPSYDQLVNKLEKEFNVILLGGKKETYLDVLAYEKDFVVSFAGNLSLIESIAMCFYADVLVSNDTGILHAAEAINKNVICIMGPTSKELAYPYRKESIVIEKNMWCRPCSKNGSGICIRLGLRPCLSKITVDEVYNKIKEYLNK